MMRKFVALLCVFGVMLSPLRAAAWQWETHSRIPEVAVRVMQHAPVVTAAEAGVPGAEWNEYLAVVESAPERLGKLFTGLPSSLPVEGGGPLGSGLIPAGSDMYPFRNNRDTPQINEAECCPVFPEDNLDNLNAWRIEDFRYIPRQANKGPCGIEPLGDPTDPNLRERVLRTVLGWHAASIDDHVNDTVLWNKPFSTGLWGIINEVGRQTIGRAGGLFIGLLVFAANCLGDLLEGDTEECELGDLGEDITDERHNPWSLLFGAFPGFGDVRSSTYVGLWHMIHVDDSFLAQYNDPPGMRYWRAGPSSIPGVFDLFIMGSGLATGLTLNAGASQGIERYAIYDDRSRNFYNWQDRNFSLIEYSSVDNLAEFGFDRFFDGGGRSAEGLGWPLHALGDVSVPQHVVATSSHGHVPCEDWAEDHLDAVLPMPTDGDSAAARRILIAGYRWWRDLENDGSIERMVRELARDTRSQVNSQDDWAYTDGASFLNMIGETQEAENLCGDGNEGRFRELLERGTAATLGFLLFVSRRVGDTGSGSPPQCAQGESYRPGAVPPFSGCTVFPPVCDPPVTSTAQPLGPAQPTQCVAIGALCEAATDVCCTGTRGAECTVGTCRECSRETESCMSQDDCCGELDCNLQAGTCEDTPI